MNKRQMFGQHVLHDSSIQDIILNVSDVNDKKIVYEIGTGLGELTQKFCSRSLHVFSCELDKDLYYKAEKKLSYLKNLTLIQGDGFFQKIKYNILTSNLPYSESSRFIRWLSTQKFEKAVVTLQREFANKLMAQPGTKSYKAISALAQYLFKIEEIIDVHPNSFNPPPKVYSKVMIIKPKFVDKKISPDLLKYLRLIFSFRGKKVSTAIRHIIDQNKAIINKSNPLILNKRVEKLYPEDFVKLFYEDGKQFEK